MTTKILKFAFYNTKNRTLSLSLSMCKSLQELKKNKKIQPLKSHAQRLPANVIQSAERSSDGTSNVDCQLGNAS